MEGNGRHFAQEPLDGGSVQKPIVREPHDLSQLELEKMRRLVFRCFTFGDLDHRRDDFVKRRLLTRAQQVA